jgi:hypothetical protein
MAVLKPYKAIEVSCARRRNSRASIYSDFISHGYCTSLDRMIYCFYLVRFSLQIHSLFASTEWILCRECPFTSFSRWNYRFLLRETSTQSLHQHPPFRSRRWPHAQYVRQAWCDVHDFGVLAVTSRLYPCFAHQHQGYVGVVFIR